MKALSRLLEEEGIDPLEANLLRVARNEGPTADGRRRILAGLGVAAAVGTAAKSSAAAAVAPSAVKASAGLKWLAVGAVAVGASVAGLAFWQRSVTPLPALRVGPAAPAAVAHSAPQNDHEAEASSTNGDQPVTRLEDLPTLPAVTAADARAVSAPSLADEVAAIKSAKTALAAGNPSQALRELDAYRARFPRGSLSQEAAVVRIETLVRAGSTAAANAAADRFLAANASSPYAARVRTLVGR